MLVAKIEQFRERIRYVDVQWVGPSQDGTNSGSIFQVYSSRRLDLSVDRAHTDLVYLGYFGVDGIPIIFDIPFRDLIQTEVRFGDYFSTKDSDRSIFVSIMDFVRDPESKQLRINCELTIEFVGWPGEPIVLEGFMAEDVSIEQYLELSWSPLEQFKTRYNIDQLEDRDEILLPNDVQVASRVKVRPMYWKKSWEKTLNFICATSSALLALSNNSVT